jgi:hypothetical protein
MVGTASSERCSPTEALLRPVEENEMTSDKPGHPGESTSDLPEIHPSPIWGGSTDDHRASRRDRLLALIDDELAAAGHRDVGLAKRIAEKVARLYEE